MAKGSVSKMLSDHAYALARIAAGLAPGQSARVRDTLRRWGCYTMESTGVREYTIHLTDEGRRLLEAYEEKFGPVRAEKERTFAPAVVTF